MIAKNYINKAILKNKSTNNSIGDFSETFNQILGEISNPRKTLNILNKDFTFNFKLRDLHKFKKFKTIAIIGMGGSILGAEAIHCFLEKKIKKKFIFLMI